MVIYIQEDGWSAMCSVLSDVLPGVWKDLAAGSIAFLCASAMVILAIKQRKRSK